MPGGPVGRSTFAPLLFTDLRRLYIDTGKERPLEYPYLMNVIEMETNPVKDQQISGLGPMPGKPEGSQFQLDQGILGGTVSVTAVPFGMARASVREMARSSNNRQELDGGSLVNHAFDNAFPGFDGVSLAHVAHPRLDG